MKQTSFTSHDIVALVLRITIAIVLFAHGAQKLLGWWNGFGYEASMQYFTRTVNLPAFVGWLTIMIEFFGPLFLLAGLATRFFSFAIAIVMLGVIIKVQHQFFYMNWFGNQPGEGMEFFLLMIGLCVALIANGAGRLSIDHYLVRRYHPKAYFKLLIG
jgi:putative oxidoreductase